MGGAYEPDLREGEPERLCEQRQQDVSHVGESVVQGVRRTAGSERAPPGFLYNALVHILVYILATLYILLALGLVFAYYRSRHPGTLLMAMAYGLSAGVALGHMHWWPFIVGFVLAWVFRFMGLDPGVPREPRP
jgi:hypothetical protein